MYCGLKAEYSQKRAICKSLKEVDDSKEVVRYCKKVALSRKLVKKKSDYSMKLFQDVEIIIRLFSFNILADVARFISAVESRQCLRDARVHRRFRDTL